MKFHRLLSPFDWRAPYLGGDNSKSFPGFPGSCRFDGCIESKQVGLVRDVLNHHNDASDFLGPFHQLVDGFVCR